LIIGDGMLASMFIDYKNSNNIIIFASGVSNSSETREKEFLREKTLVENTLKNYRDKLFIYFSSCSLDDPQLSNTPYHIHKRNMEQLIKEISNYYIIFRVPNIIGRGGNKNTIINFLFNKIKQEEVFDLWINATRNIVDIEDLYKIVSYIINNRVFKNIILNIAYEYNYKVEDIVHAIENILNKKAKYNIINKGADLKIDIQKTLPILNELKIVQPTIETLIKKYKV